MAMSLKIAWYHLDLMDLHRWCQSATDLHRWCQSATDLVTGWKSAKSAESKGRLISPYEKLTRQYARRFYHRRMKQKSNSDSNHNTAMLTTNAFETVIDQVRCSNLNFQLQMTPFLALISIKKSLIKGEISSLKLQPFLSRILNWKGNWLILRKRLNRGTVPLFKMHPGGTVPPFKMHPKGTVPPFKMHPGGTLDFYQLLFWA